MPERRKNAGVISGRVQLVSIAAATFSRMIGDLSQGRGSFGSNRAFQVGLATISSINRLLLVLENENRPESDPIPGRGEAAQG